VGWSYRKSKKIAPGLRLNISRRSLGLSAGLRCAKVSVNTRRQKGLTLSLLGLLWRKRWR